MTISLNLFTKPLTALILLNSCFISIAYSDVNLKKSWYQKVNQEGFSFEKSSLLVGANMLKDLLGVSVDTSDVVEYIDILTAKIQSEITSTSNSRDKIKIISKIIFEDEGFIADPIPESKALLENISLPQVIKNKRGVCMSLSMLYLILGDRLSLPLYGVSVPLHFFVRYDDGKDSFNIETLAKGKIIESDEFYQKNYFVRKGEPFYLESLDARDVMGVLLTNNSALYANNGYYEKAIMFLNDAKKINSDDVEPRTLLGIYYRLAGDDNKALVSLLDAVSINARDDIAHYHLSKLYFSRHEYDKAIKHHDEALLLGHEVDFSLLRQLERHREDSYYATEEK